MKQERFIRNMRALWRLDAGLALQVDAVPDRDRLPLARTRSGSWTARRTSAAGNEVFLHSRVDPIAEARRWADSIPTEDKYCFVVAGMGLGYHIRALYKRLRGGAIIICIEPSLELIATALAHTDLAEVLGSGKLTIVTDADKSRIHQKLGRFSVLVLLGSSFLSHPASLGRPDYQEPIRAVVEFFEYARMSAITLMINSRITCRNLANNLATYVATPPIDMLKGRFKGCPAVLVSAGPSLTGNMKELAGLKGKAVLIAVQTVVRPLLEAGITPDFVTSLDYHEISKKFFEGVEGLKHVHLVAEPKVTWHVPEEYEGPISMLYNPWVAMVVGDQLAARAGLKAGSTVSHLSFYLAVYMGCDPIILVGQDLAFPGGVYYFQGAERSKRRRGETNRFCTAEMAEWERIARDRHKLREVGSESTFHGNSSGRVFTDELLLTYKEHFEKDIPASGRHVINVVGGGVSIRGTEAMGLKDAGRKFCREGIDPGKYAYREALNWWDAGKLEAASLQLRERIGELGELKGLCDELMALLEEMRDLTGEPDEFNQKLVRVDALRVKIHRNPRIFQIINTASQVAEFRRFRADQKMAALSLEGLDLVRQQLTRDSEFLAGLRQGTDETRVILEDGLTRIEERLN